MLKSLLIATLLLTATLGNFAHAETKIDPSLFIDSVSVSEVEPLTQTLNPTAELPTNPIGEVIAVIDSMIAIGKKIWPIIDAGRPVINNKLIPAISILPHLEGENPTLNQMSNWSIPKVRSYRVSFKNGWGSEVVGFTYTLYWQHSGDYKGVGKYVTNLKVQASEIYTSWGFNFDATSELAGISNVGSTEAPVASGIIQVAYIVKGLVNEVRAAQSFYVDGNGNFQVLNN
jgi:hypothetical protein